MSHLDNTPIIFSRKGRKKTSEQLGLMGNMTKLGLMGNMTKLGHKIVYFRFTPVTCQIYIQTDMQCRKHFTAFLFCLVSVKQHATIITFDTSNSIVYKYHATRYQVPVMQHATIPHIRSIVCHTAVNVVQQLCSKICYACHAARYVMPVIQQDSVCLLYITIALIIKKK